MTSTELGFQLALCSCAVCCRKPVVVLAKCIEFFAEFGGRMEWRAASSDAQAILGRVGIACVCV